MGKIRRLAGETVLYGLGSIVPRFLNFLLVRLHTDESVFAPAEYGVITKLFAYVAVINVIFIFGMETAYFRFANNANADEKKIFNLAQTVVVSISASLSLIFLIFTNPITDILSISGNSSLVIWLVAMMFIDAIVAIPFARLRYYRQAGRVAVGKLGNIVIVVGLNIYFLFFLDKPDVAWVVISYVLANSFYLILFFPTLLSWRPAYDRKISPAMFSYAYPIMLTGLAGMTNEMFSRVSLDAWLPENFYQGQSNEHALGVFGACYKLAVLMNLAIQAFRYAAEPFFFSNASEKNSLQLFARINHYFIIVCCVILLAVGINLDLLKYFLGQAGYWQGLNIVPILLLAYLFLGVYYNFSIWFKLTDKTYFGTLITIGGAVITIIGNYFLIPVAGYVGSSVATLLCYFSMAIACYILGQKIYPIPYSIVKGFSYILITTALVYIVNSVVIDKQILATAFHVVVLGLYLLIIYFLERKHLKLSAA